ncbi:tetratricopeptide repeat protein [Sorangium atrum]|uniref:Tetratricopeptide repeat protein n=1 Tax=Sorangium atrum TaxID=2995308 RepID=A0ABT5C9F7_9BACT|nr:tetratricopeptide repeat protein [Sorangium aterium]MDC0683007.1 tetratricopeptide repeat protein [Sorangium aterium]
MTTDCRSELLTRVRRGVATEPDRLAFDAHLDACESCRTTWEIAQDFDAVGAAEPGDAERLARIVSAAIGAVAIDQRREGAPVWPASAPVRPDNDVRRGDEDARPGGGPAGRRGAGWRRSVWLYAAAVVLACGVAAATTALVRSRLEPTPAGSARLLEPAARAVVSRSRAVALAEAVPPPGEAAPAGARPAQPGAPAPVEAALPALAAPAPRPRDAGRGPSATASSASTAEQLFREANEARRAGNSQRAVELYRSLQKSFATSPEATLSLVSLGNLLLNTGAPAAALVQLDRYLGVAGSRPLAVEALYGRGRALRALGRSADEAQNWRRLLRDHPGSPYVEHARRRLAELGG